MTESNRWFAETMFDAIGRRDLDTFLAGVSDDVEFRSLLAEAENQVYRGHEGVRRWWTEVRDFIDDLVFELAGYVEQGEAAVTKVRVKARYGTARVEQAMWQTIVIRDGKAVWWQTFRTEAEALAAMRERTSGG